VSLYLDIGEVFPMVSGGGQEAVMWQVLELAPTNKVVWSSEHIPAHVLHRSSARETSNVSALLT